jgi:hypothetical protein
MSWTWAFSAFPVPTTACFIWRVAYSKTPALASAVPQIAARIAVHEHPFDGDFLRLILRHDGLHAAEDFTKPSREFHLAGANYAAGYVGQVRAGDIQHAEAGALRSRIDPEHANGRYFKSAQFESS